MTALHVLALTAAALSYPISPVDNADDARWQAFIGCWAPFTEDGHVPVGDHVVCIRPSRDGAVITTVDGDSVIGEQVIIPNERLRHVHGDECNGTERARWSNDGARIYTKEVLACGSDAIRRESIGAFSLAGPSTLLEVQAVGAYNEFGVRVQQYRSLNASEYPAEFRGLTAQASTRARLQATTPLSMDDIIDANRILPAQALQALLAHTPEVDLHVDANSLVALSDAGVDPAVIDILVALSYPEQFAVRAEAQERMARDYDVRARMYYPTYDPFRHDRYWRYGRAHGFYRYGTLRHYGRSYSWYYARPRVIIIDRSTERHERPERGRYIKGRGYTREDGPSGNPSDGRRARPVSPPSVGEQDRSGRATSVPARPSERPSGRRAKPRPPQN